MNAWFEPTEQWPVPHPGEWPDDIRITVGYAMRTAALVDDLFAAFQASPEVAALRALYSPEVEVAMRLSSSRKYTTFEFPNCPGLMQSVLAVLSAHELAYNKPRLANHRNFTIEFGTLRIGAINETFYFGVPRGASHPR